MPQFDYTALDASGTERTGRIDAASHEGAVVALKRQGMFPTEIRGSTHRIESARPNALPEGQTASQVPARPPRAWLHLEIRNPWSSGVSARERALFTHQLSLLLQAGMPLLRGMEVLERQQRNKSLRAIICRLEAQIRSGGSLSSALAQHPAVFSSLYVNMVKAGEAGGVLDGVLARLAKFEEKSLQLRGKVRAAMAYPVVVLLVAATILVGLLLVVVPKFQQIFTDLLRGAPLPALTQAVLGASDAVRDHYLLGATLIGVIWVALVVFRRTATGARLTDGWLVQIPLFGELILKALVARFARTFGTLLASGVPILQAILITRDTAGNVRVSDALDRVHEQVRQGETVARPLESSRMFPAMVSSLIEVGEHTGQLPGMLNKIADIYDDEVDTAVAGLSSLLEPILIVLLAGVVGTIVVALFLPIVRIVQLLT